MLSKLNYKLFSNFNNSFNSFNSFSSFSSFSSLNCYKKGISGANIILQTLIKYNVNTIFGYTGGAILPVTDMFYKNNDILI